MTQLLNVTRTKLHARLPSRSDVWRSGRRRMEQPQIAEPKYTLAGVEIFAGLPTQVLERVHKHCSWRRYEPGEPIVDYLDSTDEVFFVSTGEVCVTIYSLAGKAVASETWDRAKFSVNMPPSTVSRAVRALRPGPLHRCLDVRQFIPKTPSERAACVSGVDKRPRAKRSHSDQTRLRIQHARGQ